VVYENNHSLQRTNSNEIKKYEHLKEIIMEDFIVGA
jgi:hypothetical protein